MIPAVPLSKAIPLDALHRASVLRQIELLRVLYAPHEPDLGQVFETALKATNILLQTPELLTTLMQIVSTSFACPHKYK